MTVAVAAAALLGLVGALAPARLPAWVGATIAIVALAGLDIVGAVLASRWSSGREPLALVVGMATFGLLFVVYARGLSYATLTTVTLGWVVLLQVGVVVIDNLERRALPPPDRLAVIVVILALQGYLVLTSPAGAA
jgi:low temperature requirement protein LtrA